MAQFTGPGGRYVIGADIGTTGTKAMLVTREGQILARAYRGYPLTRIDGHITQDPRDWYKALCETVREILTGHDAAQVESICLSSQGGSLVWADANFEPICPAISWMDGVDAECIKPLQDANLNARAITGWELGGWSSLEKLCYWGARGARWILSTVDYLSGKLTGVAAIDPSNAAMQMLFNVEQQDWDDTLCRYAGVTRDMLPKIVPSGEVVGRLTKQAAADLGLTEETVYRSGGHDQYCAAYGAGVQQAGDMILSCGTSWVTVAFYDTAPESGIWGRHVTLPLYSALDSIGSAGASMEWACRLGGFSLKAADEAAARVTDPPVFVPGFGKTGGARLSGLELDHDPGAIVRGVMEGVVFETRRMAERYGVPSRVLVNGGASKSKLWMQLLANALGRPITVIHEKDMACLGAARLAGMQGETAFESHVVAPDADFSTRYARYLEVRNG